jgi:hypothetical protein
MLLPSSLAETSSNRTFDWSVRPVGSQPAQERRSAPDCGEYREAVGVHTQDRVALRRSTARSVMSPTGTRKAAINESEYPHIVGVAAVEDQLDVESSRRIMDFHRSRKIQARHGRQIVRQGQVYFRWCFSDLAIARPFMEQFGVEVPQPEPRRRGESR